MREYERYEYAKEKCPNCGCRNKVYTPLFDAAPSAEGRCRCAENEHGLVGFLLKCCNCGFERPFIQDHIRNGLPMKKIDDFVKGMDICFQPSPCNHTKCPLYGSCPNFWQDYGTHAYDWDTDPVRKKSDPRYAEPKEDDGIEGNFVVVDIVEKERFR